jgi:FkbM family methyltransferase
VLGLARDAADGAFLRLGRPPLSASPGGADLRGYLRHRSFLAEASRPRTTIRELFVAALRPGLTVVDGGAHVGLYTVLAARGVGQEGLVLAFEPDPYNLAALEVNVRRAGGQARVVPKALGAEPGEASFHISRGTIGSSLVARGDTASVRTVEVTSVDAELARENPRALLVKLNVEGAEPRVLAGMRRTLARVQEVTMFVEVNPPGLREAGTEPEELLAELVLLGFDVSAVDLATQTLTAIDPSRPLSKGHLHCERR